MSLKSKVVISLRVLNVIIFILVVYFTMILPCSFCATREEAVYARYRSHFEFINTEINISNSIESNINKVDDKSLVEEYNSVCFGVIDDDNFKYPEVAKKVKKDYCRASYEKIIKQMIDYYKRHKDLNVTY